MAPVFRDRVVALRGGTVPKDALVAADLRGADLRGLVLEGCSLRLARLDGADLSDSRLTRVELTGASLRGARLEGASLRMVELAGAVMADTRNAGAWLEQVDLTGADLSGAHFQEAMLRACVLERARLDRADLSRARLVYSLCNGASFQGTRLSWTNTVGSTFADADLFAAEHFFLSREIIAEILERDVGAGFDRRALVGAVLVDPSWCYAEWKRLLAERPRDRDEALRIFERYPNSGCAQALRRGWSGEPRAADESGAASDGDVLDQP
jgi:uncharacterized protein YjbI with pentapeptide repeats